MDGSRFGIDYMMVGYLAVLRVTIFSWTICSSFWHIDLALALPGYFVWLSMLWKYHSMVSISDRKCWKSWKI